MRFNGMRSIKQLRLGFVALAASSCLTASAGAAPQGIVLTGGNLTLDFADPSIGGSSTTLDRLDVLNWSGGSGALATQNLVSNSAPGGGCSGDPREFWGQSYGEPEETTPAIVYGGVTATASNLTATTLTSTTIGYDICGCGANTATDAPAVTVYNVFPAGDPNVNEFRVSRTLEFGSTTPVFTGHGVHGYTARMSDNTYDTVLIPNAAGTAVNTMSAVTCQDDCEISDWNGVWFADDNGSGTGLVVFRDPSSTAPALLSVNEDGLSDSNLTSIILIQPSGGWKAPVTETEWLCFYDPTTWTAADRLNGTLPKGCAQKSITPAPQSSIAFAASLTATPGSTVTSNTVQMTGITSGTPISITGGQYSINGGAYTSAAGTVNNGDYVSVQAIASTSYCDTVNAVLTVGGVQTQFSVTTPASNNASVALAVSPQQIMLGQSATLTWYTANATSCTASNGWSGGEATAGSATVIPAVLGSQTYTLTCNGSGTATASVNVIVVTAATPVPTVTLTATPASIILGASSTLTWSSTNATACTASGAWSGAQAVTGTASEVPTTAGTQSFILTCTGAGGSAAATATLTATAPVTPVPTVSIAVSPSTVTVGTAATLTWSSTNATACTASGAWSGAQAVKGTASEVPTTAGTESFILTCTGAGGTSNATATLAATAAPAPTVTIVVNPTVILLGDKAALTWSSSNAVACTASGAWKGTEAESGTANETPTASGSSVFTLTCTGAGGSATATATLTVNPPPAVVTVSSGHIGGGGAINWSSLLGLATVTYLIRRLRSRQSIARLPLATALVFAVTLSLAVRGHAGDFYDEDLLHGYFGVRAEQSIYKPGANSILSTIGPDASEIQALNIHSHQFGGVVYAGVPVWKDLSVELGYAQIGQFPLSLATVTPAGATLDRFVRKTNVAEQGRATALVSSPNATTTSAVDTIAQEVVNSAPPAGHGITLGLAVPFDIGSRISVEPRFAALLYQSKQTLTTYDATLRNDSKGVGVDAGAAISARVFGPVYVGASVDCFHENHACNVLLLSGQIEYRFGR